MKFKDGFKAGARSGGIAGAVSAIFRPLSDTPALRSSHNNEGEESSPLFELMRTYQTQIDAINALQIKIDDLDEKIKFIDEKNHRDELILYGHFPVGLGLGHYGRPHIRPSIDIVGAAALHSLVYYRMKLNDLRRDYLAAWRDLQTTQEDLAAALAGKAGPSLGCGADALFNIKPPRPEPPQLSIYQDYLQGTTAMHELP